MLIYNKIKIDKALIYTPKYACLAVPYAKRSSLYILV